jgi:hypothetical protein
MKTPTALEVMAMTKGTEFAKVGAPRIPRPAATYRGARRMLGKAIRSMQKRGQHNG